MRENKSAEMFSKILHYQVRRNVSLAKISRYTVIMYLHVHRLLIYSLNYVLERMDLMRSWVDIEVEKVSICVICAVRTVKVWVTFCGIARFIQSAMHYF